MAFLKLMYITNNKEVAKIADKYGVDRVWVDLETLGKEERQGHIDSVKSKHTIEDIKEVSSVLKKSEMLVRVNPINKNSFIEINEVIEAGADIIMLPMWKSLEEIKIFLNIINKRVKTTLLLETKEAVECLDDVLNYGGFDEIHIGLNDLHLSYSLNFMFELLSNGMIERICKTIKKHNIPYGFGGIAKIGEGIIPAEKIVAEHYRLGSSRVILSRTFCNIADITDFSDVDEIFDKNITNLRNFESSLEQYTKTDFENNRDEIKEIINKIVQG